MTRPHFEPDCEECVGGWAEPLDMPNDTVLALLGVEPCSECPAGRQAERWFEENRAKLAAEVV